MKMCNKGYDGAQTDAYGEWYAVHGCHVVHGYCAQPTTKAKPFVPMFSFEGREY